MSTTDKSKTPKKSDTRIIFDFAGNCISGDRRKSRVAKSNFVQEGRMVAMPLMFPGASLPVPADESRLTALTITPHKEYIYAGTSGKAVHIVVALFHDQTGVVFDIGKVPGAVACTSIVCLEEKIVATVNSAVEGRIVSYYHRRYSTIMMQEWFDYLKMEPREEGVPVPGEKIIHAVPVNLGQGMAGITRSRLFMFDPKKSESIIIGEVPHGHRMAIDKNGVLYGRDEKSLWRFDPKTQKLKRRAVVLPRAKWSDGPRVWTLNYFDGYLYTADDDGHIFCLTTGGTILGPLGRIEPAPVTAMCATYDGRIFGMTGNDLANLFVYDSVRKEVKNLGPVISVLERRRLGYAFADAITGRDGEIIFAENDDLGHLWLYFPRILEGNIETRI